MNWYRELLEALGLKPRKVLTIHLPPATAAC